MITVIAADKATEKALIWFSLVISLQTVFISLHQKTSNHQDIHKAQIIITQRDIPTLSGFNCQLFITSFMAARGHIAFATSFAQCAKLSKLTANIRGMLNIEFINFFEFLSR